MKIEHIDISKLNPAAYNPRKDLKRGDAEYDKLANSIDAFGYVDPIIWNERTGNVVGGHQRLKILKDRGEKRVEVSVVDLDDASEKALNIALNKISGDWEFSKLADLLLDLDATNYDMDLTGFGEDELKQIMGWTPDIIGDTSTDRDGQGVASPWQAVKASENVSVKIGDLETRIIGDIYNRLMETVNERFDVDKKPIFESFAEIITAGLDA